jgi:two-component system nitrogen regulation sensor histidine kinase NtrY
MTLRGQFRLYIIALHLLALAVAAWYYKELGAIFFVIEVFILLSAYIGMRLINTSLKPLEFVRSFRDLLNEHEFSTRFSEVGQLEMDQLIDTYNVMLRDLYDARLKLGDQQGFLERFMQVTPLGVLITDFDGRINLANPAAADFLGADSTELTGKGFNELQGDLPARITRLETGSSELVLWQGARRLRVQKQAFQDRGFDREFVILEELTALLNESERAAFEKVIRLMSHEVNNTIASTNSLLESCRTYAPQVSDEDRDDFLNALRVVITRNEHLNAFMRSFAEVVKLPDPNPVLCNLEELIAGLEPMFRAQCAERDIQWRSQFPQRLPRVRVDHQQIEQVLINIIKNGIEAIGKNGIIELEAEEKAGHVTLKVYDNGSGLDPKYSNELFTPFFTSKSTGQGLGLTLVKEVLLRHKFEFGLESLADGRTCFHIKM